jgi:Tfp pilus assembly protein PilF
LWNEYAGFLLESGQPAQALAAIDEALRLDDLNAASHLLRGHAVRQLEASRANQAAAQ